MTPHQILSVAVRLFAIWLAFVVLRGLVAWSFFGPESNGPYFLPLLGVVGVVGFVFVAALWFFPKSIARGLLPAKNDAPAEPSAPVVWFGIGISLIGLWVTASALPGVLRNLVMMYVVRSEYSQFGGLWSSSLAGGLIFYSVQLVVGVVLIIGANGISRAIWWARHAGPR